ncbi:hypothetical protein [Brevibacillus sp. BC25]|uniref:hypothetical protein n=1 Tax=Brevibacillus sp. BC25 TaxID=1144308 RepID=UPI000270E504|nr:hypothetical protein [Brevibacillus sp. BC25]EJL31797.1 hypothetical protein PMI05_00562 [Brevibacillus sp. BC25]
MATRFPAIKYRIISDEFGDDRFDAYLIDEDNAIEIDEYGVMKIIGVVKTDEPGVYLDYSGMVALGPSENESDIDHVVDRLRSMSAYELVTRFMVRSSQHFELNIVEMKIVDPTPEMELDEPLNRGE